MSDTSKPVWVWLPGQHEPTQGGTFALEAGVGRFAYAADYRARADALALDPMNIPFSRSKRGLRETRQGGLFGVFRDASPEGFGLALLEQIRGTTLTDPMQRLELSEGDSVGALEVCDDIAAKMAFEAPTVETLLEVIAGLPRERASSHAAREVKGLKGTSLGGERPKLTVLHKGQLWIAKLQDHGDPAHAPLREFVCMRLAAQCDIKAAEVEFVAQGEREVLLVRRFDRRIDALGRTLRNLYASAHTVLRLDTQTRGERTRSYVALAHELQRWCGLDDVDARELKRELWRRMAFNAICGNGDDHPRNHGLLHRDGRWGLADAFDIAPYITFSGTLAMAITRDGSAAATTANLLKNCDNFAYGDKEARQYIEQTRKTVADRWPAEVAQQGFAPQTLPIPKFDWLDG
jgi:serine/threonine-protein kinase HipA